MRRNEAVEWLKRKGYTLTRGRMFYHPNRPKHRYVANELVLRFEELAGENNWVMVRHGYYGEMCLTPEDKLSGLKIFHL